MSQTVVLKVGMSCGGCAGAVRRVLGKMEGVESFDIDQEAQKVTVKVKDNVTPNSVLETVSKTGKKTSFWVEEQVSANPSEAVAAPPAVSETEKESSPGEEKGAAAESGAKPSEGIAIA